MKRNYIQIVRLGISALALIVATSACNQGSKDIVVEGDQKKGNLGQNPPSTKKPGGLDGEKNPGAEGDEEEDTGDGEVKTTLSQSALAPHVDLNAKLSYRLSFLIHKKDGEIQFKDGKAEIKVGGLTTNKSGTITLEILENGKVVLKGSKSDVTLKKGGNSLDMKLEAVSGDESGNGGETDLSIEVTIDQSGNKTEEPPKTDNNTSGSNTDSTRVTYADIKPLSAKYCDSCHPNAGGPKNSSTQDYWDGDKQGILSSIQNDRMPRGTKMSAAEKEKMVKYLSQ